MVSRPLWTKIGKKPPKLAMFYLLDYQVVSVLGW